MIYEKKKYEELILSSELFSLNKDIEYNAYKREALKMIENLYCYLMSLNRSKYEEYGCEITNVAKSCIRNYDSNKGEFLSYFNSAWKQEYQRISSNKSFNEKYHGLHVPEEIKREIRKYRKLVSKTVGNRSENEINQIIAEAMNLPVERVAEISFADKINVSSETFVNDNGDESSLFDLVSTDINPDDRLEISENMEELLTKIEEAYIELQDRQKPVISDMMTLKICSFLKKSYCDKYSFINISIINEYTKNNSLPTQRDIAMKYNRNEASISRTVKTFIEKLRNEE